MDVSNLKYRQLQGSRKGHGALEVAGKRFGKLVAEEEFLPRVYPRIWLFRCDCGGERVTFLKNVTLGGMKCCGCSVRRSVAHGLSKTREYKLWLNMRSRCYTLSATGYSEYGGRGISVCDRWNKSFEDFFSDVGPRPFKEASLDRIDVNGNYCPENCRWASQQTQCRNMRSNRIVVLDGREMTLAEAVDGSGLTYNTVLYRLKRGWLLEDAIKERTHKGRRGMRRGDGQA